MSFSMLLFWFRLFDSRIYFWACKENCASFIKHVGPTQGAILRSSSIGLIQLYDIFSYQIFWLKDLLLKITRQICVLKLSLANFRSQILYKYCKSDWEFAFSEVWYSVAADAISPKLRGNKILRRTQGSVWCINLQYTLRCAKVAVHMVPPNLCIRGSKNYPQNAEGSNTICSNVT